MPPDSFRLFIAIELPTDVCDALVALQQRLRGFDHDHAVRWGSIDAVHLTLKFLGDTPATRQPSIEAAMQEAVAGLKPFDLTVEGAGCFPDLRRPRVVWAGVGGGVKTLHMLRDAVERTVSPLGYPTEDRPFSPHLTLGRAKQEAPRVALSDLGEQIGKAEVGMLAGWHVEGISLMRSDLKPSGAVYTQVRYVPLNP